MSTSYDVGADQVGFVMTRLVRGGPLGPDALSRPLSLVLGWSEDVAQRVQAAGK
jgi:hypothetical protein